MAPNSLLWAIRQPRDGLHRRSGHQRRRVQRHLGPDRRLRHPRDRKRRLAVLQRQYQHLRNSRDRIDVHQRGEGRLERRRRFTLNVPQLLDASDAAPGAWYQTGLGEYGTGGAAGRYYNGDVGEVLAYRTSLSPAARQEVEAYLRTSGRRRHARLRRRQQLPARHHGRDHFGRFDAGPQ